MPPIARYRIKEFSPTAAANALVISTISRSIACSAIALGGLADFVGNELHRAVIRRL